MLYLMITGVVGFAEGYSQTEARWFDNAAAAKAAYDIAVDGWREVTVCDRFQSNNLTQCTFKVPFRAVTMGIDVYPLDIPVNPVAQNVGGYLVDESTDTCPIFVTYHKAEDISETTQYEDHFIDPSTLHYFSKSNRTLGSADMQYFMEVARSGSGRMPLFVKKNDDEGIDFYFLGDIKPIPTSFREDRMQTKDGKPGAKVVRMDMALHDPVPSDLYQYLQDN